MWKAVYFELWVNLRNYVYCWLNVYWNYMNSRKWVILVFFFCSSKMTVIFVCVIIVRLYFYSFFVSLFFLQRGHIMSVELNMSSCSWNLMTATLTCKLYRCILMSKLRYWLNRYEYCFIDAFPLSLKQLFQQIRILCTYKYIYFYWICFTLAFFRVFRD